jgi:hypothetical protein
MMIDKRSQGSLYLLVDVEVNYNCGMALYAPNKNEETMVHKKQGCGTTCGSKFGQGIVDPTQ